MLIELYFIRHGFSYGNALCKLGGIYAPFHKLYPDPPLTQYGKLKSKSQGQLGILNPDIVLSSVLLRAIQTGIEMFPNHTIYPAPYIIEDSYGLDNVSSSISNHEQVLGDKISRVDYRFVTNKTVINNKHQNNRNVTEFIPHTNQSNYLLFLLWVRDHLSDLISTIHPLQKKITIAVITHSYFMKKNLLVLNDYPKNNSIIKQVFTWKKEQNCIDDESSNIKSLNSPLLSPLSPLSNQHFSLIESRIIDEGVDYPDLDIYNKTEKSAANDTLGKTFLWNIVFN
jgi:hypothetical protein